MLGALIQICRRVVSAPWRSSGYRPERHYMRGAGPASRRKTGTEACDKPARPGTAPSTGQPELRPSHDHPSPAELDALFQQQGRPLGASPAIAWGDHEILLMSGATGRYVTLPVERRPPFPRDVLAYDTRSDSWRVVGEMPVGVVTTSATRWTNFFVIPSGETRPGVRTPRVQAIRVK